MELTVKQILGMAKAVEELDFSQGVKVSVSETNLHKGDTDVLEGRKRGSPSSRVGQAGARDLTVLVKSNGEYADWNAIFRR